MLGLAQSGGTRNALTKSMIEKFVVPRPKLEEQNTISGILSCLDARIMLNKRMNNNIEGIAKAIFKRWFIDFEFPNEGEVGRLLVLVNIVNLGTAKVSRRI